MEQQTDMQLAQIYDQMQLLAEQAKINERKKISEFIYTAEIRFEPFINHTYHLYQKETGVFRSHSWDQNNGEIRGKFRIRWYCKITSRPYMGYFRKKREI